MGGDTEPTLMLHKLEMLKTRVASLTPSRCGHLYLSTAATLAISTLGTKQTPDLVAAAVSHSSLST